VKDFMKKELGAQLFENDAVGMKALRLLPHGLKKILKSFGSSLGLWQGSLYEPKGQELSQLLQLVPYSDFEFKTGKCLSSRHLDAIACGTWQVLSDGNYSGVLKSGLHFTSWNPNDTSEILELIQNEEIRETKSRQAHDSLRNQTYESRVDETLIAVWSR
jgi:hypothetical protein